MHKSEIKLYDGHNDPLNTQELASVEAEQEYEDSVVKPNQHKNKNFEYGQFYRPKTSFQ